MPSTNLPQLLRDHLEKIYGFSVVVRTGSIRKAAVILKRSQPSVSRSIQVLETALDMRLLERSRQGVHPTSAGTALLELSQKISTELVRTEHLLRAKTKGHKARLLIGSYESLAIRLWPSLIQKVSKKHPGISITLKADCADEKMLKLVRKGQLDLALTITPDAHPTLIHQEIYQDSFSFYASPSLVGLKNFSKNRSSMIHLSLSEIQSYALVLVPRAHYEKGKDLEHLAASLGLFASQVIHQLDSYEAAKEFILNDIGIGLLPRWFVQSTLEKGDLVEIKIKELKTRCFGKHTFYASYTRSNSTNDSLQAVITEMKGFFEKN